MRFKVVGLVNQAEERGDGRGFVEDMEKNVEEMENIYAEAWLMMIPSCYWRPVGTAGTEYIMHRIIVGGR